MLKTILIGWILGHPTPFQKLWTIKYRLFFQETKVPVKIELHFFMYLFHLYFSILLGWHRVSWWSSFNGYRRRLRHGWWKNLRRKSVPSRWLASSKSHSRKKRSLHLLERRRGFCWPFRSKYQLFYIRKFINLLSQNVSKP